MQRSLQQEWNFAQRATPCDANLFKCMEESLRKIFCSNLFGSEIDQNRRIWSTLLIKRGGIAIPSPSKVAALNNHIFMCECGHLINCLQGRETFDHAQHLETMQAVRAEGQSIKEINADATIRSLETQMDEKLNRRIDYLQEKGTGAWLAATPSYSCGAVLSPVEFQDEIRDRHGLAPLGAPSHCNGCN